MNEEGPGQPDTDLMKTDLAALEAFVIANDELNELEQLLAGFNLFEALGNVRREERHSDFLAFLLNPAQPHGLDDAVLRAFIHLSLQAKPIEPTPIRRIDAALFEMSGVRVEREWNNIDILVTSESDKFVLLVENKVDTDEHSDQLRRYLDIVHARFPDWSVLPVFLTRDGHEASHPSYHCVSYSGIHAVLTAILARQRAGLPPDIEVVVRHYVEMLERHIMEDTRIAQLARKIYARHSRALDLIFEHRPDSQEQMREELVAAIGERDDLRLVYASKADIQFVPVAWDGIEELHRGGDGAWAKQTDILRFEFRQYGGLSLHLLVGPGQESIRRKLYAESGKAKHGGLFKKRSKKLTGQYTQFWRLGFLSKSDDAELSVQEKSIKFRDAWQVFLSGALPKLTEVFVESNPAGGE